MSKYDAVLFIGFGGPEKPDEIRPFLQRVTQGRGIPPERIEEVAHHYEAIGGRSPINEITHAQAKGLERELQARGVSWPVYVGNRNWHPFLEDTLRKMQESGITRAIGFYTAAQRSEASLERYRNAVETARKKIGDGAPVIDLVGPWFDHPLFIEAICERVKDVWPGDERSWIFTAHSIPCSMAKDSTYVLELQKAAELVCARFGIKNWKLAYSSRSGNPRDPWLEPDICDEIRERAAKGDKRLLVIPIGFIADHVEILFDLDVEAAQVARETGVTMIRAKSVGDHPIFCRMMADVVMKRASESAMAEMTSSASTRYQDGRVTKSPGKASQTCYCEPESPSPRCAPKT